MRSVYNHRLSRALMSAVGASAAVALAWWVAPVQAVSGAPNAAPPVVLAGNGSTTTVTMKLQAPDGGEFLGPGGNISCEVDNGYVNSHEAYCQTVQPPESVTLKLNGTLHKCRGATCIGNPAENVKVLRYGVWVVSGPFHCYSSKAGITCTVDHKGGFLITTKGVVTKVKP